MKFENPGFDTSSAHEEAESFPENSENDNKLAQYHLLSALRNGNMDLATEVAHENATDLLEDFLKSEKVQEAVENGILIVARRGDYDSILSLDGFLDNSRKGFFQSQEVQDAAKEGFINKINKRSLAELDLHDLYWFAEKFGIRELPEIKESIKEKFIAYASGGFMEEAETVKEIFDFPIDNPKEVQKIFLDTVKEGKFDLNKINRNIPSEFLESQKMQRAVIEGITKQLTEGNWNDVLKTVRSPRKILRCQSSK